MAIDHDRHKPKTAPLGVAAQRRTAGRLFFAAQRARGMPKAGEKSVDSAVAVSGGGHRFAIPERTTWSAASTERMLCRNQRAAKVQHTTSTPKLETIITQRIF